MERQRPSAEFIHLIEAGASKEQIALYAIKLLEWAKNTVANTPTQTHTERYAINNAKKRLETGICCIKESKLESEKP